jgi:hypothetical protein
VRREATHRNFAGEVVEAEEELDVERVPEALLDEQLLQVSIEQPVCTRAACVSNREQRERESEKRRFRDALLAFVDDLGVERAAQHDP